MKRTRQILAAAVVVSAAVAGTIVTRVTASTVLEPNFVETEVARGISAPTAMAFAPDGRLFVSQQGGKVIVVKNGVKLATPFLTLAVSAGGTQGLMGLAFDPNFATNHYVYVHYTAATPTVHNRVSRFVANGDVSTGTETVLIDLPTLNAKEINHDGGDLAFGNDGKLLISVGDNLRSQNGQDMTTVFGKILRINTDGSIPTDNPFYGSTSGINRAIFALGVRNPFKMSKQPGTGRIFISDVGNALWEEVNELQRAGNFGWPLSEGPTSTPGHITPVFAYSHTTGNPTGCAVTAGAFYNPPTPTFPARYVGDYFVGDYCQGWLGVLDISSGTNSYTRFAEGLKPVDLEVGSDGALYYLERENSGRVMKLNFAGVALPHIDDHPNDIEVEAGSSATFSVVASGTGTLTYQWLRNEVAIPGAISATYTLPAVSAADNGALFRVRVSNSSGPVLSDDALLTVVTPSTPPVATIVVPEADATYQGGDIITFAGTGTDVEDGTLPASAFTWEVVFHHDEHTHPYLLPFGDATEGQFPIPVVGETSANVWYRIHLTVTDSGGKSHSVFRDIHPRTAQLSIDTNPPGLRVDLDGQPKTAPLTVTSVINVERTLEAPATLVSNGRRYEFASWSDGGTRTRTLTVPTTGMSLTANFTDVGPATTRTTAGLVALYQFPGGSGSVVPDQAGDLDLTIVNPNLSSWDPDGLRLAGTTVTDGPASAITSSIKQSNEFTLEAWVAPSNPKPTDPAIVCIIGDTTSAWNASISQGYYATDPTDRWEGRFRTSTRYTNRAVGPTAGVSTSLNHVVLTRNAAGLGRLFVNGVRVGQIASTGTLSPWSTNFPLTIGGASDGTSPFFGTVNLVAVYSKALTDAEIAANREAGPAAAPTAQSPTITTQPQDATVSPGETATFSVQATGTGPLTYVWSRDGVPLAGQSQPTLVLPSIALADDHATFTVTVSNASGSVSSRSATLHVHVADRVTTGLRALYDFDEGSGNVVHDNSGVGAPLDLSLIGTGFTWTAEGISLSGARLQSATSAFKVNDAVRASNEYTMEVWVTPRLQSPAKPGWVAAIGQDATTRNAVLSQGFFNNLTTNVWEHRLRSSTSYSGRVQFAPVTAGTRVHIVVTRLANGNYRLYVNGVRRHVASSGGTLSWDRTLPLVVGGDSTGLNLFDGSIDLVAFYSTALDDTQVLQNFAAG